MGIFSKLFRSKDQSGHTHPGKSAYTPGAGQATVKGADGQPVLDVEDTMVITGRGLVAVGVLRRTVEVGDVFEVLHDGQRESLRVGSVEVAKKLANGAAAGSRVGLLLQRTSRH